MGHRSRIQEFREAFLGETVPELSLKGRIT